MSASEKLKALDGAATPGTWHNIGFGQIMSDGKYILASLARDSDAGTYETMEPDATLIAVVRSALPQIVAVVEAAERAHDEPHDFAAGVGWSSMGKALTALESALGGETR